LETGRNNHPSQGGRRGKGMLGLEGVRGVKTKQGNFRGNTDQEKTEKNEC